ncbi:DUF123 domain-containing protein [Nanohaloarchaea archaeon H01]|nr:DUF123 domain-containing protein [Nanohaloarchaea archaeon H01]
MVKGSYTLLVEVKEDFEAKIPSIGQIKFRKGFYIYNGSAFGPGGFKRVERHRKLSKDEGNYTVHWHIDHLTSAEKSEIIKVFKASEKDLEDELTREIDLETVEGFGASDSEIDSHLLYCENKKEAVRAIKSAYRKFVDEKDLIMES